MSNILNRLNPTKKKKEVMDINLVDGSFRDEIVEREQPTALFCKKHDGYTPITFKDRPGFNGKIKRWLSVEATPTVAELDTTGEGVKLSPIEYLKTVWGEKGYEGLPTALKESLLAKIGITVSIKPRELTKDEERTYKKLKAEMMLYDTNLENAKNLGESKEVQKWHDKMFDKVPWIGFGMGLWPLLQALGILK